MSTKKQYVAWLISLLATGVFLFAGVPLQAADNPALGISEPTIVPDPPEPPPPCKDPPCDCKGTGSPISARDGILKLDFTDLDYNIGDISFSIERTYASQEFYVGHFGPQFTSSLEFAALSTVNGEVGHELAILRWPAGQRFEFLKQPDSSYTGPVGQYRTLTKGGGQFVLTDQEGFVRTFDANTGLLLTRADKNGHTVTFTYNGSGQPTTIELFPGREITINWGVNGFVDTVTDFAGRMVSYQYDPQGMLTQFTDAVGEDWTYQYGGAEGNLLTGVINPLGEATVTVEYDGNDRVSRMIDATGDITYTYAATTLQKRDNDLSTLLVVNVVETAYFDSEGVLTRLLAADGTNTYYQYDPVFSLTGLQDANGDLTQYQYDSEGRVILITYPDTSTEAFTYHPTLNLKTSRINELGVLSEWEYDTAGNMTREALGVGTPREEVTLYAYDLAGHLTMKTDPAGLVITNEYDALGQLTRENVPGPIVIDHEHDLLGNRTRSVDSGLNEVFYEYDNLSRHTKTIDPVTNESFETYDAAGRLTSKVNAAGDSTTFAYDAFGKITLETNGNNQSAQANHVGPYLVQQIDGIGRETLLEYDLTGMVSKMTRRLDTGDIETLVTTDNLGNPLTKTDPSGLSETRTYDVRNRLDTVTRTDGFHEDYNYDPAGRLTQTIDTWDNTINRDHDELDRFTSETDDFGTRVTIVRDSGGRTFQRILPRGTQTFSYDSAGRQTQIQDADGNLLTFAYDALGRRTGVTRPGGLTTSAVRDAMGRPTSITSPNGRLTDITYRGVSQTATVTEPGSRVTSFGYDGDGNVTRHTLPDTSDYLTEYDAAGRMTSRTLPNLDAFTYEYSDLDMLTKIVYPDLTEKTFAYNAFNQLTSVTRGGDTITFGFDAQGRTTSQTYNARTITYQYSADNKTQTTLYPSGRTITRQLDNRTRTSTITLDGAPTALATYTYDADDVPLTVDYDNGVHGDFTFSGERFITGVRYEDGLAATLRDWQRGLNDLGSTTYTERVDDPSMSYEIIRDNDNRITEKRVGTLDGANTVPAPTHTESWSLDQLGNWDSYTRDGATETRTHGLNNQIVTRDQGAPVTFVYDANGNLEDDGTYLYTYNFDNLLSEVRLKADSSLVESYQYDPMDQLVSITTGSGDVIEHVRDDKHCIETYRNGLLETVQIYGNTMDQHLCSIINGTKYYHLVDMTQSTAAVTDNTGAIVESYEYEAYGEPTVFDGTGTQIAGSAIGNDFLFQGRLYRPDTGNYYYRARFQSPDLGRFLTPDLLGLTGTYEDNLYQFVNSSPVDQLDPYGLCIKPCVTTQLNATISDSLGLGKSGRFKLGVKLEGSGSVKVCNKCCDDVCKGEVTGTMTFTGSFSLTIDVTPLIGGIPFALIKAVIEMGGGQLGLFVDLSLSGSASRSYRIGGCDNARESKFCIKLKLSATLKGGIKTPKIGGCQAEAWVYGGGSASRSCCTVDGKTECKNCFSGKAGIKGGHQCKWGKKGSLFSFTLKNSFDIVLWEIKSSGC